MRKELPTVEAKRRLAVALCEEAKVTMRFIPGLDPPGVAYFDNKNNPHIDVNIPSLDNINVWEMVVHHEISHLFPELSFTYDVLRDNALNNLEFLIFNILADNLCERARLGDYAGRDDAIRRGRIARLKKSSDKFIKDREHIGISALIKMDLNDRMMWMGLLPECDEPDGMEPYLFRFEEIRVYERLVEIAEDQSARDMLMLVKVIAEAIMKPLESPPEPEEEKKKSKRKPSKGKGKGKKDGDGGRIETDSSEGDEEDPGEDEEDLEDDEEDPGEDDGDSDEDDGDSDEDDGDSDEDDGEDAEDYDKHDSSSDDSGEGDSGESGGGWEDIKKPDFHDEPPMRIDPRDDSEIVKKHEDYTPFERKIEIIPSSEIREDRAMDIAKLAAGGTVSKKIRKLLKIASKSGYNYGLTKGKLHNKSLHRILVGDSPRIFKDKQKVILNTDSAVEVMLDCSGSMNVKGKYVTGAACCVLISKTLTELRIPHEVLGFSETHALWTYMFKTFIQSISPDKLISSFAAENINLSQNADGESVLFGAERLAVRPEKNKIMIVLSDGSPCGTYTGNGYDYLRRVVKAIEASGIHLVGIGIRTDAVKRFYTNHCVVDDMSDLDGVLFKTLQSSLL